MMDLIKAIVQDKYGSPDVLELKDVDKPVAREEEVLGARSCRGRQYRQLAPPQGHPLRDASGGRAAQAEAHRYRGSIWPGRLKRSARA